MGVFAVAPGQLLHQLPGELLVHGAVGAVVVALAELVAAALKVHPGHFGIILHQPSGHGSGGGGQHNVVILPAEHVDDVVQLAEIIGPFVGLELGPGEHIDRGGVDAGLLKQPHVLLPNLPGPLAGVVIAAIKHAAEGRFHDKKLPFSD